MTENIKAWLSAAAFALATVVQLILLWRHRHVRHLYPRWRVTILWLSIAATGYFALAYITPLPVLPGRTLAILAILALVWHVHDASREQEREVARLYERIRREREMAEERRRLRQMRQDTVTAVSHELRTPLTTILGYSKMLKDADQMPPEEMLRKQIAVIYDSARRLFIGENRIIAAAAMFTPKRANLVEIIKSTLADDDIWLVTRRRPDQVSIMFDDGQPPVWANVDASKLRAAVFQLVHNAIKFSHDGGLIVVIVEQVADGVAIVVNDDGPGIDPMHHDYIFDMLSQVHDNIDRRPVEGMGMGLWVARELVHMHGGTITVESEPGQGSTFTIRLPR